MGWSAEQAYIHANVADGLFSLGRFENALANEEQALALFEQVGHAKGMAGSLFGKASCLVAMGRVDEGVGPAYQAMRLYQELGDANGEGIVWNVLADAYQLQGENHKATQFRERGIELHRLGGSRINAGDGLI